MAFTTEEREREREKYVSEREKEECVGVKVSGFPLLLIRDPTRPDPTRFEHEHSGEERGRERGSY